MRGVSDPTLGLLGGASRIGSALRMLSSQRSLWLWCALPLALNLALFALGVAVFFTYAYGPVVEWLGALLAVAEPEAWYQWIWVGPLVALAWVLQVLLAVVALLVVCLVVTLVGGVVAAPFLDELSRRVERVRTGRVDELVDESWRATVARAGRSLVEELKLLAFLLVGELLIAAVGLIPGLQVVAAPAAFLFAAMFLALDYTGYVLERRGLRFRERRAWLWRHRRPLLGFGTAAFATFLVPGLNFLSLPVLVTGGTLLALELG